MKHLSKLVSYSSQVRDSRELFGSWSPRRLATVKAEEFRGDSSLWIMVENLDSSTGTENMKTFNHFTQSSLYSPIAE
uniref:Uncharacterized protein n=1 Tax=Ascaris lumbricoides TaxID=6252 RepID=A0A0M3I2I5_ASCLU